MTETAEQKLSRYECVLDAQMAEIDRLRAEVQRLIDWIMGDADAHTCLQAVYNDPSASQGNRIKAAAASLPFEKPKLVSVEPPVIRLNVIPLAQLLEERRARQDRLDRARQERLEGLGGTDPPIEVLAIADGHRGNGDGSS